MKRVFKKLFQTGIPQSLDKKAHEKIKHIYGTADGEYGPNLFVEHHLDALDAEDWEKAIGVPSPTEKEILESLILINSWSQDDDETIDTFDFGLPNDISDYVISVVFNGDQITEIVMES
ncbi:MAG: DUF2004 domain-containing protein [Pseudomonadota bacterium]